jgi:hypothetical protein
MPNANSLAGLMKWIGREEWRDDFAELFDRHVARPCLAAGVEVEDLASLIGEDQFMTLWGCAFEDFLARELDDGRNIVDDYLKRRGWKENVSARAYIAALRSSLMSLYEVSNIVLGESFLARDLVRGGNPIRVNEKSATRYLHQWDRIAARVIEVRGKTVMSGGVLIFEQDLSDELLASLSRARKTTVKGVLELMKSTSYKLENENADEIVSNDMVLQSSGFLFTNMWLGNVLNRIMNPYVPEISNTDGEPLELQSLHYPLLPGTTAQAVRTALASIPDLIEENDQFWNWVEPKHRKGRSTKPSSGHAFTTTMADGAVVLGNLELKQKTLTLSVNSRGRGERGKALLDRALAGLVREPLIETQTVEQMMVSRRGVQAKVSSGLASEDERALIHRSLDDHYGTMLNEPIPAFGNATPTETVKTAKGREKVITWLKTLENHSARMSEENLSLLTISRGCGTNSGLPINVARVFSI